MSSFFTVPASQRKRKRTDGAIAPASKKRNTNTAEAAKAPKNNRSKPQRDESISGSESDDDDVPKKASGSEDAGENSESDHGEETAADRRLRLAERYLENIREEVDEVGFDAADIDRDLIAERLKEDVAETKGRLYRRIASDLSFQSASYTQFRADTHPTTAIATCPPYVYTVSKDMTLIKWELATPPSSRDTTTKKSSFTRRRPKQVAYAKGNKNKARDTTYQGHVDQILTVAASADGKFVATGGRDRRLIIWNAADLMPLRVFTQHRDSVTGLAFRRGTNQLYSSAKDRTIKTWSLDELAYVETLFGHQDEVVDVAALAQERCISVGARDRTARLWKVVEETQLVFRGGGGEKKSKFPNSIQAYAEGSIDRVAMIDEETFVTGSDNGSISLWTLHKKKPVFTFPLAHGLDPPLRPDEASAEQHPDPVVPSPPQPRWITALATIPYSDVILSGSWDGQVRAWKVSDDKRRIEALGPVGASRTPPSQINGVVNHTNGNEDPIRTTLPDTAQKESEQQPLIGGVINGLSVFERGDRGKDGICIVAAVGTEHRLGRWKKVKGKNGAVVFEVARSLPTANGNVGGVGDGKDAEVAGGDAGQI